jgi:hypothetical protein
VLKMDQGGKCIECLTWTMEARRRFKGMFQDEETAKAIGDGLC